MRILWDLMGFFGDLVGISDSLRFFRDSCWGFRDCGDSLGFFRDSIRFDGIFRDSRGNLAIL